VKVIDDYSLWKSGQSTGLMGREQDRPKLRFAGEQQLTSAILALSQEKKPKVAFIRSGGPPRTTGFMTEAPYSAVAERLRSYNFEVLEKDITGMAAMGQQMPPGMDASDEEIKDAIWVVLSERSDPRMGMMNPPGALGQKLKEHLDGGGSALCLIEVQGDDLAPALSEWGIVAKPNVLICHEKIEGGEAEPDDFIEQARRQPFIFILNEFGSSPVTTPLRSLDAALVPMIQVSKAPTVPEGVTVTEIVPIPTSPQSWGETDLSPIMSRERNLPQPSFDPAVDSAPPIFAGAIAQRKDKGRLIVIGCQNFISNLLLDFTDPKLERSKVRVARFPGNGELFTNSIFWLAQNEKMIALSPSAMDTARIKPIAPGALNFIRVGLAWIGLPLLAIAAGIFAWFVRRD
jgi:hypothetical protein